MIPRSQLSGLFKIAQPSRRMASSLSATMRAVKHNQSNNSLSIETIPLPNISGMQYLIRVFATAPCAGELTWPRPPKLSISIPGVDAAGVVVKAPSESKFQVDDEVYYRTEYPHPGSLREFSTAEEGWLAHKPKTVSFVEAAAIPVSALTAWQALFDEAKLASPTSAATSSNKGLRILVNGASGGVGLWVVQLAKLAGLTVIGTASPRNAGLVKSLGAHDIVDYTKTNLKNWISENESRKVDIVFNSVSRKTGDGSDVWHTLKPNGRLFSIVPAADMQWKFDLDTPEGVDPSVKGKFFIMRPDGGQLGQISELVDAGKLKPVIDSTYAFEQYNQAFKRSDSGRASGKVVVKVADE